MSAQQAAVARARSAGRSLVGDSTAWGVAALTVAAALLRFVTIDAKGFWQDEVYSVHLVEHGFYTLLSRSFSDEPQPPLYFVLAWGWTRVFGDGEAGIRTLSALAGTATVAVAYAAGARLLSRRVGLVAAALVAANPLLVWYSQEAKPYALLVFLTGLSLVMLLRALDEPTPRTLVAWVLVSGLAMMTHYFAVFLIAPEAAWLVLARARRAVFAAVGCVAALSGVFLVLASRRQPTDTTIGLSDIALADRVVVIPGVFLVGFETAHPLAVAGAAALLAAVGLGLLVARGDRVERQRALLVAALGLASLAGPLALAVAGHDYFLYRYVIASLLPLLLVLAAGFGARRAGTAGLLAAGALCAISVAVVAATAETPKYRREDWRRAAAYLGAPVGPRAIVATPQISARAPLELYVDGARRTGARNVRVREIDVLGMARRRSGSPEAPHTPRPARIRPPAPGFRLVERVDTNTFTLLRFRAPEARVVSAAALRRSRFDRVSAALLLQRAE